MKKIKEILSVILCIAMILPGSIATVSASESLTDEYAETMMADELPESSDEEMPEQIEEMTECEEQEQQEPSVTGHDEEEESLETVNPDMNNGTGDGLIKVTDSFKITPHAAYVKCFNWNGTKVMTDRMDRIYWMHYDSENPIYIYPDAVTDTGVYIFYNFFDDLDEPYTSPVAYELYMDGRKYEGTYISSRSIRYSITPGSTAVHDLFFTSKSLSEFCPGNSYDGIKAHYYTAGTVSGPDDFGDRHEREMVYCTYIEDPLTIEWYRKDGTKMFHASSMEQRRNKAFAGNFVFGKPACEFGRESNGYDRHNRFYVSSPIYNDGEIQVSKLRTFDDAEYTWFSSAFEREAKEKLWKRANTNDVVPFETTLYYKTNWLQYSSHDCYSVPLEDIEDPVIRWYEYDPNPVPVTKVTVKFDPNQGNCYPTSKEVNFGEAYGDLPSPSRAGYNFEGWFTAATGGTKITKESIVGNSRNHTLYAHWKAMQVKVMLDPNEGICSKQSMYVSFGGSYGALPTPARAGYIFDGWYTELSGGKRVSASTKVNTLNDHTLYAHWDDSFEIWGFSNAAENYGNPANGYVISLEDRWKLTAELDPTEIRAVNEILKGLWEVFPNPDKKWGGSCYGMSSSALLVNNHYSSVSDFGLGSDKKLSDFKAADSAFKNGQADTIGQVESVINFFHAQQMLPEYQNLRWTFWRYSATQQLAAIKTLAQNAQTKPAIVDLFWIVGGEIYGHTIAIKGYREAGSSAVYPHCVLTYDCSYPDQMGNDSICNIYFDDYGNWAVPGWGITPENAYMICGTDDAGTYAPVDYKTGTYRQTETEPTNITAKDNTEPYTIKYDDKTVTVDHADVIGDDLFIIPEATDVNEADNRYKVYVPEDKDYTIESDRIDHVIYDGEKTVVVEAEEGGSVVIKDKEIDIQANDEGKISVKVIGDPADDTVPDGYTIHVDGAKDLSVREDENGKGLIVEGDDLSTLVIETENGTIRCESDENSVLIAEDENGTVKVYEDIDGDGEYETEAGTEEPVQGFTHSAIEPQTYTGDQIKPAIQIYHNGLLLKEKTDYTLKYTDNTNVGKATITITGKGNFGSSETVRFDIVAKSISDSDVNIAEIAPAKCTNNSQEPVPKITYGKKILKRNKDFNAQYYSDADLKNPCTPGAAKTYYLKISGIGNYTGTETKTFTIAAANEIPVSALKVGKIKDKGYTGDAVTLNSTELVVKSGNTKLSAGEHYSVSYRNNTLPGTAKVIITGIDPYAGTRIETFKITGKQVSKVIFNGLNKSVTYDGSAKTQNMDSWTYGTSFVKAILEKDYYKLNASDRKKYDCTVTYQNNVNAGTATMIVTGVNGFTGTKKQTFKITPFNIERNPMNRFKISLDEMEYPFAKSGAKPLPTVTFNGIKLTEGKDYTLSYANNKTRNGRQSPLVKVKGKGNFKGTGEKAFVIKTADLEATGVRVVANDVVYSQKNGGNWKTKISLVDADGKTLSAGKDYDKNFTFYLNDDENQRFADTAVLPAGTVVNVRVKASEGGDYTGTLEGKYRIVKSDISKLTATVKNKTYTGNPIAITKEDVTWKAGSGDVTFEIDPASYTKNTAKGTATVNLIGTGNYGGKKTVKFVILPKWLSWLL